jgi:hypothetical protein
MAAGVYAREQRLRKQAELQSLKTNLVNLREQEESYVNAQAVIPVRLTEQITKIRQEIEAVEDELVTLGDETIESPAQRFYREAFAAELAQEFDKALKLYKNAARQGHVEANTAIRSLRYLLRTSKNKDASLTMAWASIARTRPKTRFPLAVIIFLIIFILILTLFLSNYLSPPTTEEVIAIASTVTATLSAGPATFVLPATPTTIPTPIPATSTPTSTPRKCPKYHPQQGASPKG